MVLLMPLAASCLRVEPIHIVVDVNIRVDRELDEFFAFEKSVTMSSATQAATQPAPAAQ